LARIGSKTNWIAADIPAPSDLNRIENNNAQAFTELDTEVAARIAADSVLQGNINAEAALARNADNLLSGTVADARIAATIARDTEVSAAVAAEALLARNGDNITSGTVADARIASTIARDSEVTPAPYTGSDAALLDYPVGTILIARTNGITAPELFNLNTSVTPRVVTTGGNEVILFAFTGWSALNGTWKTRGRSFYTSGQYLYLIQRIA